MGGQTIRQLEELLRHGNPEEVEYQNNMVGNFSIIPRWPRQYGVIYYNTRYTT